MASPDLMRVIEKLSQATDERAGQIIGIAAILACMPETARIDKDLVSEVVDAQCANIEGGDTVQDRARQIAYAIINLSSRYGQVPSGGDEGGA